MSYILDALKKSDQERRRGTVPGLDMVPFSVRPEPRRPMLWPSLIGFALLLNAGLLLWWLQPWRSEGMKSEIAGLRGAPQAMETPPPAHEPSKASSGLDHQANSHPRAVMTDTGPGAAPATPAPSAPVNHRSDASALSPPVDSATGASRISASPQGVEGKLKPAPTAMAVEAPRGSQKSSTRADEANARVPTRGKATASVNRPVSSTAVPQEPSKSAKADRSSAGTPAMAGATKEPRAPSESQPLATSKDLAADLQALADLENTSAKALPGAQQLPSSIRGSLPKLNFSMLIYSEEPNSRKVSINGRMIGEGQEVSDGLKVEEITPRGAVMNYHGHRFYKGVTGN